MSVARGEGTKLREREIAPGLVAYLDHRRLHRTDGVVATNTSRDPEFKVRGFLCVAVLEGESAWVPLTTTSRPERLYLRREWRTGGGDTWQGGYDVYLLDGASLYMGPNRAFINASACENRNVGDRAYLTAEGLAAVNEEIAAGRRRRASVGAR